jgi:uncharacterized protein (TIGR00730 family)
MKQQDLRHITRRDIHTGDIEAHIQKISSEFRNGFEFLKKYPRSVSIFGSSQLKPDHPMYKKAEELGGRIVQELGYAVITGGGPGIMQAANKGAYSIPGVSAGLTIDLPHEHSVNGFTQNSLAFSYFFSRKAMLAFAAEAYVFFPGGFGTCDELFGLLTLIQTDKIPRVPVLLYDSSFWNQFKHFVEGTMLEKYGTIDKKDMDIFEITDSLDHVIQTIKKAPISEWWKDVS